MAKKNHAEIDVKNYGFLGGLFQYFIVRTFLWSYFKIFFNYKVEGRENIPDIGKAIIAPNHTSHLDPPLVAVALKKPISYMAKKELFDVPVLSFLIRNLRAFAVNREKLEVATIKSSKKILKNTKWLLGIFPQGGRGEHGKIEKIKPGFGFLAKSANVPVIPVGIVFERDKFFWCGNVTVKVGKPIQPEGSAEEICEKWAQAIVELTGFEYECAECSENCTEEKASV